MLSVCLHRRFRLTFDFNYFTIGRLDKLTAAHFKRRKSSQTSGGGCPNLFPISANVSVVIEGVLVAAF